MLLPAAVQGAAVLGAAQQGQEVLLAAVQGQAVLGEALQGLAALEAGRALEVQVSALVLVPLHPLQPGLRSMWELQRAAEAATAVAVGRVLPLAGLCRRACCSCWPATRYAYLQHE